MAEKRTSTAAYLRARDECQRAAWAAHYLGQACECADERAFQEREVRLRLENAANALGLTLVERKDNVTPLAKARAI